MGVDVCSIERLTGSLVRTPALRMRLFTSAEAALAPASLAARFAAKEALAKALGAPGDLAWTDAEVVSEPSGRPSFSLAGGVLDHATSLGVTAVHLSLSHDAGIATALVVVEG